MHLENVLLPCRDFEMQNELQIKIHNQLFDNYSIYSMTGKQL